jgi:nucleotide-binding universal stress UspA family protein
VPVDGSPFGEAPLAIALGLARRSGAAVSLVRVHLPQPDPDGMRHWDSYVRGEEEDYLALLGDRLFPMSREPVRTALLDGNPARAIGAYAEKLSDALIVMATHGRTGIGRTLLGSTADRLLRRSPLPVLLVRPLSGSVTAPTVGWAGFRRIVVALDGTSYAEELLPPAATLARVSGASLLLLHIAQRWDPSEYQLQRSVDWIHAAMPELTVSHETMIAPSAAHAIADRADELHADVVAVASHATLVSRWFAGSTTDHLLGHGPPILMVMRPGGISPPGRPSLGLARSRTAELHRQVADGSRIGPGSVVWRPQDADGADAT